MGHIDHGKTSLLDYIRKTRVAEREAGGITQHLGAYELEVNGKPITFLDTPGHEAFCSIRERGSRAADVALLVIAATEGVKPQTLEALQCIKDNTLPFIVVCTKMDLPDANIDEMKKQLSEHEVVPEDWGGNTPFIGTSVKTGQGIDELLEMILLVAEMEELTANPEAPPEGVVLESSMDARRGIVTTILVTNGILRTGDTVFTRSASAKIKLMEDFKGERITSAGPSSPCLVIGWEKPPQTGEPFSTIQPQVIVAPPQAAVIPELAQKPDENIFTCILKADVAGSLQALQTVIEAILKDAGMPYRIISASVGDITLGDMKSAENTNATIIGFRSKPNAEVRGYQQISTATIISGDIIYRLTEQLTEHLRRAANPNAENIVGSLSVLGVFAEKDKKDRQIVGGRLSEGYAKQNHRFTIVREEQKIGEGKVLSLRKDKQESERFDAPVECGLHVEILTPKITIVAGDTLQFKERNR
jgi:translation initiation factor IF-2